MKGRGQWHVIKYARHRHALLSDLVITVPTRPHTCRTLRLQENDPPSRRSSYDWQRMSGGRGC